MRTVLSALAILIALSSGAAAESAKTLEWDDLLPPLPPLVDPFLTLEGEQQDDMMLLTEVLILKENGVDIEAALPAGSMTEVSLRAKLAKAGVDVADLLRRDREYRYEIQRRETLLNDGLNGQDVKIPGYALPLEFSGEAVSELLLVPYVGACIHVPPPPANQTVFVRLEEPYKPTNLYDPVWVTGRLSAKGATKDLSLVDGQAAIDAGYTLEDSRLEPYEE